MRKEAAYGENGECLHHDWNCDRTNFGTCLVCKEERQFADDGMSFTVVRAGVPRRPRTRRTSILHDYYLKNHEAIIKDYIELGLKPMLERWDLSPGTWPGLKSDWIKRGWMADLSPKIPKSDDSSIKPQAANLLLVKCEECRMFSRHVLTDESGTVLINACAFNITLPVAVDGRVWRTCCMFQRLPGLSSDGDMK